MKNIQISRDKPYLKINYEEIIEEYINNVTGNWMRNILFRNDNQGIHLQFTKTSDGWKGHHLLGWWLAFPKFHINGTITLDGKSMSVAGEGYHTHNIYPIYIPLWQMAIILETLAEDHCK